MERGLEESELVEEWRRVVEVILVMVLAEVDDVREREEEEDAAWWCWLRIVVGFGT